MRLRRRALPLGLACMALARAAGALPGGFVLTPSPRERLRVSHPALAGSVYVPASRARLLAEPGLGGTPTALVGFGADPDGTTEIDLVAVIGADAAGLRVLALELASWRHPDGAHLDTRLAATPDHATLVLTRQAAAPRPDRLAWRREGWTDFLAWRDGAPMADAPLRAPRPGSWQAAIAIARAATRDLLAIPRVGIDETLCAAATTLAYPRYPSG